MEGRTNRYGAVEPPQHHRSCTFGNIRQLTTTIQHLLEHVKGVKILGGMDKMQCLCGVQGAKGAWRNHWLWPNISILLRGYGGEEWCQKAHYMRGMRDAAIREQNGAGLSFRRIYGRRRDHMERKEKSALATFLLHTIYTVIYHDTAYLLLLGRVHLCHMGFHDCYNLACTNWTTQSQWACLAHLTRNHTSALHI